jgi:hypothetical protein
MGMRSADRAPNLLLLGAAAQALEAAALFAVIVANLIDLADGHVYQKSGAIAIIVLEAIVAIGVAWIASGIVRMQPWTRTPAAMTQVFTLIIAVWLLEAHRLAWGLPALIFALAGLAGLFAPTSLRKLNRPRGTVLPPGDDPPVTPRHGGLPAPHTPRPGLPQKPRETRGKGAPRPSRPR